VSTDNSENLETIAKYISQTDELSGALKKHLSAYDEIQSSMKSFSKQEKSTFTLISKANNDLQEYLPMIEKSSSLISPDLCNKVMSAACSLNEAAGIAKEALTQATKSLKSAMTQYRNYAEEMTQFAAEFSAMKDTFVDIPALLSVTKSINQSLSAVSDVSGLEALSQKLESQIAEIRDEKQIVQELLAQNNKISEEIKTNTIDVLNDIYNELKNLKEFSAPKEQGSLISFGAKQKEAPKLSAKSVPSESPDDNENFSIETLYNRYKLHSPDNVLIIVNPNWTNDYCVVIDCIENGRAKGRRYRQGEPYGEKGWSEKATQTGFTLYSGPSKDIIHEKELAHTFIGLFEK
jgi:uncharacterized phage infection (PIP) family protein YhgE